MMRVLVAWIGLSVVCYGQVELSDSPRSGAVVLAPLFTSDYQALWCNPANLGFVPETITFTLGSPMEYGEYITQRHWSIGAGELGASIASDALRTDQLRSIVLQVGTERFSLEDKRQLANQFAGRGIAFNIDALLLGVAYQSSGWGGIALSVRDRMSAEFRLNSVLSRIAFLGRLDSYFDSTALNWQGDTVGYARQPKRYSELFDSSRITMSWLRDYAIGYGVRLVSGSGLQLYGGVTLRLIEGYILLDGRIDNRTITAYSAISPYFNVNYGKATTPSLRPGSGLLPVGSGYGADVGFTVELNNTWRAALAMLDIGSVYWDGNVFTVLDTVLNGMITTGFSSFNIFAEAQNITGEGGYFKWSGLRGVRRQLPTRLRLALSRAIGIERDIGVEATIPLEPTAPGAPPFYVTLGTRYWINAQLIVSAGIRLGTIAGWALPLAIQLSLWDGRWELGISSQDVASLILPKRPVLSAAVALARFHF